MQGNINEKLQVPVLIDGKKFVPDVNSYGEVRNPCTGKIIGVVPMCGETVVDAAAQAARAAFPSWADLPATKRASIMFNFRELLKSHFDELAKTLTYEHGKTMEESRGDIQRGIEVVEFACGMPHILKGENLTQVADFIDGETVREPLGVCAGITPFNFPAMVPMWMFPIALACGNTFILKPSEKVPFTAMMLADLLMKAGVPDGVFNIVHGGVDAVNALCAHPLISAVSFVGSSKVAKHVYTRSCEYGKRVQSAGGAKNALVVLPDADVDSAIRAIIGSALGCTGQRCMAGSLLVAVGAAGDMLVDKLLEAMDALKMGDTSCGLPADLGPVIDASARDRVFRYIGLGVEEGASLLRDGRQGVPNQGYFVGPTLFDNVKPEMSIARDEIFGPLLSMLRFQTLDEAIAFVNNIPYGNGSTLFTASGSAARQFAREISCGMVGINVGVPAPMSMFPFSGWKESFYGDLHVQGMEGAMFYTRQKTILSRWDKQYIRRQGW